MGIIASQNPFECTPAVPARFIGEFASLVALQTAHPTAPAGSYAVVNQSGDDLIYYYSVTDEAWFTFSAAEPGTPFSQLITIGETTIDGNDITIAAGTSAQIGANIYTTDDPQTFTIPFSSAGKLRTDIIVINTSGVLALVSGTEGDIAVQPAIPTNTVLVTKIEVAEDGIGAVPEPTYLTIDERAAITYANAPSEENPFATMDDLPAPITPTLQNAIAGTNKNLTDAINLQGTGAGTGNIGIQINAFGENAGLNNSGSYNNIMGNNSGSGNSGSGCNILGNSAAENNTGNEVNAFGQNAAASNTADFLNAFGYNAGLANSGNDVNAFGTNSGVSNTNNDVNLFGFEATADADCQTVFSKKTGLLTKLLARLSFLNITADRKWELPDEDGTIALQSYVDNIAAEKADLVGGLVPSSQLPAYVDDIIEGYKSGANFYEDAGLTVLITGVVGKIYVDLTSGQSSKQYRWTGSAFLQITNGLLASTNDLPEGSNLYFTVARVLSTVLSGLSASSGTFTSSSTILEAFGKLKFLLDNIATSSVAGIVKLYTSTGSNTDGTMDQNSISNALALKQDKSRYLYQGFTTVTGVTTPTIAISLLIPATTYGATDGFEIIVNIIKSTTAGAVNYNLYHDTSINGTTNAIATGVSLTTTNRGSALQRILNLSGGNAYNNLASASASLTSYTSAGATPTTTTFNPAVDQYITLQISGLTVLSESSSVTMSIRPLKG